MIVFKRNEYYRIKASGTIKEFYFLLSLFAYQFWINLPAENLFYSV